MKRSRIGCAKSPQDRFRPSRAVRGRPNAPCQAGVYGGAPSFARIFDRKGQEVAPLFLREDETLATSRQRARGRRSQGPPASSSDITAGVGELPRGAVSLPDIPLHLSQRQALELIEQERRVCLACGRRWGKSTVIVTLAVDYALAGRSVGVFAPTYRFLRPLIDGVALALSHLPGVSINSGLGEIRLDNGAVDFWSLDFTGRAARGRRYRGRTMRALGHRTRSGDHDLVARL